MKHRSKIIGNKSQLKKAAIRRNFKKRKNIKD
jgi:hypothetical protein